MGVSHIYAPLVYNGNGATTTFSVSWEFFAEGDLLVTAIAADGTETVKTISTHYDVTGGAVDGDDLPIATPGTGTVEMLIAPASGTQLRIERATTGTQETTFSSNDAFPPKTVEGAYDRRALVEQELRAQALRSVKQSVAEYIANGELALPPAAAGQVLGWNDDGDGLENMGIPADIDLSVVTPYIATLLDDANAATARATLGAAAASDLADHIADATDAHASSAIGFLQAGTGAVARTAQDKMREWISVKDFGATGDGSTDDTTAFTAALTYCGSVGKSLFVPTGVYQVASQLTIPGGVHVFGETQWNSSIRTTSATAHVFYINAGGVTVSKLGFYSSVARTAGAYIYQDSSAHSLLLEHLSLSAPFYGVYLNGGGTARIEHVNVNDTVASTGITIVVTGGSGFHGTRIICDAATIAAPFAHVLADNSGEILLFGCDFIRALSPLYINPGAGHAVLTLRATNTLFDTAGISGVRISPTSTGIVAGLDFVQCWMSTAGTCGVDIEATGSTLVDGVRFSECQLLNNGLFGIRATGNKIKNLEIDGTAIAVSGTAIKLDDILSARIRNCKVGAWATNAVNTVGVHLLNATDNVEVTDTDVSGNTTPVTNTASGTSIHFDNCPGYNALGTNLVDPNADRVYFWDDSAGKMDWLSLSGLSITGTVLSVAVPTAITAANEATDATCFPAFFTAATGDLGPKTNANLTYNSNTGALSIGTGAAFTAGTIELGAASDTTLSRASAGVVAVEGINVLMNGGALGTPSSGTLSSCAGLPLTSGVTGTLPVGNGGTGTATAFTLGSMVFAGPSGVYGQDNANLFWDDTNNFFGVGTAAPKATIDAVECIRVLSGTLQIPASGKGLELHYISSTDTAFLTSYDRSGAAYHALNFDALSWEMSASGTAKLRVVSTGETTVLSATAATSTTTGGLQVAGGIGCAKALYALNAVLSAGTVSVAPLVLTPGVNLTTPVAGAFEADGKAIYSSFAASQRGVSPSVQIATVASGAKTSLTNSSTSAQSIFASTNDVLTVAANTAYRFRAHILLNTGATSHTTSFGIALTTATLTSIHYNSQATSSGADTLATPQMRRVSANTAAVLTAASTAVTTDIWIEGIIRVATGGSITPQITFSAGPTGTCEVEVDSFFELFPIGADTVVAVGPWA